LILPKTYVHVVDHHFQDASEIVLIPLHGVGFGDFRVRFCVVEVFIVCALYVSCLLDDAGRGFCRLL
jgi:hypothetical protein